MLITIFLLSEKPYQYLQCSRLQDNFIYVVGIELIYSR